MIELRVTRDAVRQLVSEVFDNVHVKPVVVNNVVDPSAPETDVSNTNFVPHNRQELSVALQHLIKNVNVDEVPATYKAIRSAIDDRDRSDEVKNDTTDAIRNEVRKILGTLSEADLPPVKKIPYGQHGGEYMNRFNKAKKDLRKIFKAGGAEERDEVDAYIAAMDAERGAAPGAEIDVEPASPEIGELPDQTATKRTRNKAYKSTAIGSVADVSGASFEQIAKELGFSVSGAKQAVDKAIEKARWAQFTIDPDEYEILVLTSMNDYISMLDKTGELTPADVKLMKDHPDIVRELDGFREFLDKAIRRARREGQSVEDPVGESKKPALSLVEKALKEAERIKRSGR